MCRLAAQFVIFGWLVLGASTASAERDPRHIAAEHFDRGFFRASQGDHAAAVAEFRRAFELTGQSFILFNIGYEYGVLNRPVEAVAAFDKLLATPGDTPPAKKAEAQRLRIELAARIGQLKVTTSVPASIEVDNLATVPPSKDAPILVGSGMHVVAALAVGYVPLRQQVDIAGGETREVALVLSPAKGQLAQLRVKSSVGGADVLVDGAYVGRTPLPASLPVEAGHHEVALRRSGYQMATQTITLGEGATGDVVLEPIEDPAEIARVGGFLAIDGCEPGSALSIDGRLQESATGHFRLAPGPHRLVITHSGFLPVESEVIVESNQTRSIRVDLEPTPENRHTHLHRASGQRWRAWGTVLTGALLTSGGLWYLSSARDQQDQANRDFADVQAAFQPGSVCDPKAGSNSAACAARRSQVESGITTADHKVLGGYVATGLGAAVLATGLVLVLTIDDVSKYEPRKRRSSDLYPSLALSGWAQPNGGGVVLGGLF